MSDISSRNPRYLFQFCTLKKYMEQFFNLLSDDWPFHFSDNTIHFPFSFPLAVRVRTSSCERRPATICSNIISQLLEALTAARIILRVLIYSSPVFKEPTPCEGKFNLFLHLDGKPGRWIVQSLLCTNQGQDKVLCTFSSRYHQSPYFWSHWWISVMGSERDGIAVGFSLLCLLYVLTVFGDELGHWPL